MFWMSELSLKTGDSYYMLMFWMSEYNRCFKMPNTLTVLDDCINSLFLDVWVHLFFLRRPSTLTVLDEYSHCLDFWCTYCSGCLSQDHSWWRLSVCWATARPGPHHTSCWGASTAYSDNRSRCRSPGAHSESWDTPHSLRLSLHSYN